MNHPSYLNTYPSHVIHPERVKEMKSKLLSASTDPDKLELIPLDTTKYDVETVNQITPEPKPFNWNDIYSNH